MLIHGPEMNNLLSVANFRLETCALIDITRVLMKGQGLVCMCVMGCGD